ncbi:MAG: LacI family DNA-binding transcriptional regulator [Thermomicrobiales bacterium]
MRERKRTTQRDVAARAGVSTAVVSYVINDGPRPTSPAVRNRVLSAIEELDYHPNGFARGLRSRRAHTIGFVANDYLALDCFGSHYLSAILDALTAALKEQDNYLLMYPMAIGEDPEPLKRLLRSGRLDGVVVRMVQDPPATDALVAMIAEAGLPSVCIERPASPRFGLSSVTYDDAAGARTATRHLITQGHRRIAHMFGDARYATAQARREGFRQALTEAGIPIDDALIRGATWSMSDAVRETLTLLQLPDPPTAIFAASDDLAIGSLEAARLAGRSVPDDVAIVGFDDIPLAQDMTPPLTTIRIPLAQIGRRAAKLLLAAGESGEATSATPVVLPVELIRRGSA